jgi:hypothetical protein
MGIGYKEVIPLLNSLQKFQGKKNVRLCELGNNYMKGDEMVEWFKLQNFNFPIGGQQHKYGVVSKTFWTHIGFNHTSIDLNGYDGSLKLDLRNDVADHFLKEFDVVYDGGTAEHVDNQYMCLKNIHNITRDGGLMIHILPKVGYFPKHCKYYYTMDSFKVLAELCNYEVLELFEHNADGGVMIYCALKKAGNEFIDEDNFKSVPIDFIDEHSNDRDLYPYAY